VVNIALGPPVRRELNPALLHTSLSTATEVDLFRWNIRLNPKVGWRVGRIKEFAGMRVPLPVPDLGWSDLKHMQDSFRCQYGEYETARHERKLR
jgi:hypothetical protein